MMTVSVPVISTLRNLSRPLVSLVSVITELGFRDCCNLNSLHPQFDDLKSSLPTLLNIFVDFVVVNKVWNFLTLCNHIRVVYIFSVSVIHEPDHVRSILR